MTTMPVTLQDRIPMPLNVPARPIAAAVGITPTDILLAIRQRMFLILTFWITLTAISVGVTYWLEKNHPSYQAKAVVQVVSPFPRTPLMFGENPVASDMMNRFAADQAVLMKDDQILREALQSAEVTETKWFNENRAKYKDNSLLLDAIKDDLSVGQITGTSYISVAFSARDPKDAAAIANSIVDKYLIKVKEMSVQQLGSDMEGIKGQEKLLSESVQKIIAEKQKFVAEKLSSSGVNAGINIVAETVRSLTNEVTRLEEEKLQSKALYDNIVGVDPSQIVISPQMMAMIQQDPEIYSLQQNKSGLEQARMVAMRQVGEKHRSIQAYETQIEVLDKQLQALMDKKEQEVREYQTNSAHTNFLNAMQAEMALRERMIEAQAQLRDLDMGLAQYSNWEDQQKLLTDQLNQIREYAGKLQLVIDDREKVRVKRISQATSPTMPSFPQWGVMISGGSILGLLIGIGLALMLELMDTSMRTSRDIVRHVHVPILGTVPDLDDEEVPIEKIEMAAHAAPRSMVAEAFRNIRTNLLLSSPAERQRTVLVTSAKPEEGKTTIAVNLAISIGQSGRRVLLVDANFHRPALHLLFDKSQREGLSNALIGQASLAELIRTTDLPNLDIITSGPIPPNPTELLSSPYLAELINQASARYDQIIFDGPPVLLVSDALVLADVMHGAILVCRAKSSSRGVVQRAREQLERVNAHIFGAILNAARIRRGGYFREQIRTYYDYQQEEVNAQPQHALPENGDRNKTTES